MPTDTNPLDTAEPTEPQRVMHASKAHGLARGPLRRALDFMEAHLGVAAVLGFCDQSHFSKTLRRIEGVSPSQFVRGANGTSVLEENEHVA